MDMATLWAIVPRSFVMISPKPHLRLARLSRRSTSTRSHSSRKSCVLFRTSSFSGPALGRPKKDEVRVLIVNKRESATFCGGFPFIGFSYPDSVGVAYRDAGEKHGEE